MPLMPITSMSASDQKDKIFKKCPLFFSFCAAQCLSSLLLSHHPSLTHGSESVFSDFMMKCVMCFYFNGT